MIPTIFDHLDVEGTNRLLRDFFTPFPDSQVEATGHGSSIATVFVRSLE